MKTLIVIGLFLNAALLLLCGRYLQQLSASSREGGGAGAVAAGNGDVNGSGEIDISDASYLLNWLFLGGPAPVACAGGSPELEERVTFLEGVVGNCFPDSDEDGVPDCADDDSPLDSDMDGVADASDCEPLNAQIYPGRVEVCFDNIDNNCNDGIDESCDLDADDYCAEPGCGTPQDCDDQNAAVHPGVPEVCDGIDNNCDGQVDADANPNTNPACSPTMLAGNVPGDASSSNFQSTGSGEGWFGIRVRETNTNPFTLIDLTATITLTSPPGADYDLFVHCRACGGAPAASSTNAGQGGHSDVVSVGRDDVNGPDDSFEIFIEVRHAGGTNGCAAWTLTVAGNTATTNRACN
jgi:hypothetical protein